MFSLLKKPQSRRNANTVLQDRDSIWRCDLSVDTVGDTADRYLIVWISHVSKVLRFSSNTSPGAIVHKCDPANIRAWNNHTCSYFYTSLWELKVQLDKMKRRVNRWFQFCYPWMRQFACVLTPRMQVNVNGNVILPIPAAFDHGASGSANRFSCMTYDWNR